MEHTKSSFYFTSKDDNWQVDYTYYIKNYYGQDHSELKVAVYLNNELYWDFEQKPYTKTVHSRFTCGICNSNICKGWCITKCYWRLFR